MNRLLRTSRLIPAIIIGLCVSALAIAFAAQMWAGLQPCILCIYQRYAYGAALGFGVVALAGASCVTLRRLAVAGAGLSFLGGAAIAAFHAGVEQKWWRGTAACHAPEIDPAMSAAELRELLLNQSFVACDEVPWSLFGLSIAGYNTLASLAFTAFCLWAAVRMTGAPKR